MTDSITTRESRIAELKRNRSTSNYLRWSGILMIGLTLWAWLSAGKLTGRLPLGRRWQNFLNFIDELVPSPVSKSGDWSDAIPWAWELLVENGFTALGFTIGIACVSIIISSTLVLPFLPLASRKLGRKDPMGVFMGGGKTSQQGSNDEPTGSDRSFDFRANLLGPVVRFLFVLARAVPEYVIAFLLISLLGLQVWPLILALAIHNFGILGRLYGEVVENADDRAARHAVANGFDRKKVFGLVVFPAVFNRFLIYFFYRWETCVKDATVLGMLGVVTLGHLIMLSKGFFWDQMFFYVLLGASVIMVGDLLSTWVRKSLRD